MYRAIRAAIGGDKQVHVFTNLVGVGNVEVNAFQALSKVVIQKSLREGFGLSVAEALWKGTPVVAGRAGGIPLQMADEPRARALGASGRERVRRHFLIPRLVLDELSLMRRLAAGAGAGRALEWVSHRDPVCGMAIEESVETQTIDGLTLRFCSARCREAFAASPQRYLGASQARPALLGEQPGAP